MSTRAQILAEIAAQFPDNTSGAITPAKLRQVVEDITNSYNNSTDEPAQPLDADLTAIAGLSTPGILARTNSGTAAARTVVGTANQVTVTNGDGVSGNPTLSLPQSIATTSTPQFAKLGVGMEAPSTSIMAVQHTPSGAGGKAAVIVTGSLAAPASTDLHPNAYRDSTEYTSAVTADAYASYDAGAKLSGSLAYNHVVGFQARPTFSGSNTLSLASLFSSQLTHNGSGTITTAIGAYLQDPLGTGPITGNYGLYVGALTRGATNWSIYTAGTAPIGLGGYIRMDMAGAYGGIPGAPGAVSPNSTALQCVASGANGPHTAELVNWGSPNMFIGRRANGTRTSTTALANDDAITTVGAFGHNGSGFLTSVSGNYNLRADGAWSAVSNGCYHQWNGTPAGSTSLAVWMMLKNGALRLNTYGAGTLVTDASGNITASSDARLKNVSGMFIRGLDAILKVHPKVFTWKPETGMDPTGVNVGFVAQEIQPAIPESVGVAPDGMLTLSDRPIIAALVNAVKELSEQNAALVKRIAALEMAKK